MDTQSRRAAQPVKMLPPPGSCANSPIVNGNTYVPASGTATPIHPADVDELLDAGWSLASTPTPPPAPMPQATAEDVRRWNPLPRGERELRLLIPKASKRAAQVVSGRTYPAPIGPVFDAPETDARALAANGGWMILGQVGTSEQRPANPRQGDRFIDLWVEAEVVFDGAVWRHTFTGEEV